MVCVYGFVFMDMYMSYVFGFVFTDMCLCVCIYGHGFMDLHGCVSGYVFMALFTGL
jgi:hypothetical protein